MGFWYVDEAETAVPPPPAAAAEECGVPTMYTPVPSQEHLLLAEQQRRWLKCHDAVNVEDVVNDDAKPKRLMLVKVHFMQNFYTSFELPNDGSIGLLVRHVVESIAKEIRNKFSFYVFASPYDVIWRRPRCELMRKPPRTNLFRHLVPPSKCDVTLGELSSEMKADGVDALNFYFFVKNMEDKYEPSESSRSWKMQQIID